MPVALYGTGLYGVDTYGSDHPGWEEVYGPDYPLTAGDVPVIGNAVCWLTYEQDLQAFTYEAWIDERVEVGRITFWKDDPAGTETRFDILVRSSVVEWTPERAVISATFRDADNVRCTVYITLQRGWRGPRFEAYVDPVGAAGTPPPGVSIRLVLANDGTAGVVRSDFGPVTIASDVDYGTYATAEPWTAVRSDDFATGIYFAVLQEGVHLIGRSDTQAYGSARPGVSIAAQDGTADAGYVSVNIGTGYPGGDTPDAVALGQATLFDARSVPLLVER